MLSTNPELKLKRVIGMTALLVTLLVCGGVRADDPAAELPGYRMSDYHHAAVPATLNGKPALTIGEAHDLWIRKAAAFVDVLPQPPKPAGLAPGTLWLDKPRFDIPGSIWLPDTGYGALAPVTLDYFRRGLRQASGGDLDKPLVFYCSQHCWMSWNAAKRAETLGYTHVLWYPDGTQGWQAAGYPLEKQPPFPRP